MTFHKGSILGYGCPNLLPSTGSAFSAPLLPHLCHTPPRVVSSTADRRELGQWAASGKERACAAGLRTRLRTRWSLCQLNR